MKCVHCGTDKQVRPILEIPLKGLNACATLPYRKCLCKGCLAVESEVYTRQFRGNVG